MTQQHRLARRATIDVADLETERLPVQLTNDVYRHTLQQARTDLMHRLDEAISSGRNPADPAVTGETSTNEEESKAS